MKSIVLEGRKQALPVLKGEKKMNGYEIALLDKIDALELKLVFLEKQFEERGNKILKDGGWEKASILWDAAADVRKIKEMDNKSFLAWAENNLNK